MGTNKHVLLLSCLALLLIVTVQAQNTGISKQELFLELEGRETELKRYFNLTQEAERQWVKERTEQNIVDVRREFNDFMVKVLIGIVGGVFGVMFVYRGITLFLLKPKVITKEIKVSQFPDAPDDKDRNALYEWHRAKAWELHAELTDGKTKQ